MAEPVYEMLWDCAHCDTRGNLGVTHRFCPGCGAPQDPTRRYFPPDDRKVAVQDHTFVGADWVCSACAAPMSSRASNCGSCGASKDGAKGAALVAEGTSLKDRRLVGQTPPSAPPKASGGVPRWLFAVGAILLLLVVCCGLRSCWTREGAAQITGVRWERVIEVEELQRVSEGAWADQVPSRATDQRCYEKKKDTRKIADGEDCHTVKIDQGDGTFKEKQECKPRYRSEDVMAQWCDFKIEKWKLNKTAKAEGADHTPKWPEVSVTGCSTLGCTREGDRREALLVDVSVNGGAAEPCEIAQDLWKGAEIGQTWTVNVRVMGGGVDCSTLKPGG